MTKLYSESQIAYGIFWSVKSWRKIFAKCFKLLVTEPLKRRQELCFCFSKSENRLDDHGSEDDEQNDLYDDDNDDYDDDEEER